jgi:GMP reductase
VRIIEEKKLDFSDVLIVPKRSTLSSRNEVDLKRTYTFKHSEHKWTGIPIMASNMDGVGTIEMTKSLQEKMLFTVLAKHYGMTEFEESSKNLRSNYYSLSMGMNERDLENVRQLIKRFPNISFITIDVANGYSQKFSDYVNKVRAEFPNVTIIAGNVVTAEMTQELILQGADIVKVGIGPGSVCTTRIQTGVGYPQLSAIIECADAAHGLGAHIIADGGCTSPGDIAKAFGAGADFVMLGGMLAGHKEGGGEVITEYHSTGRTDSNSIEKKEFVEFYGMSSESAMNKHNGGMAEYRSSEGRTVKVPFRPSLDATINNILGGLRSTCTYVGAPTLKQLSKCTTFIRVNNQYNKIFE